MLNALSNLKHTDSNNFYLLAGPCAIEGEEMAFEIAAKIKEVTDKLKIPFIFKGSYRKANRSRLDSFTGIGDEKSLENIEKSRRSTLISLRLPTYILQKKLQWLPNT